MKESDIVLLDGMRRFEYNTCYNFYRKSIRIKDFFKWYESNAHLVNNLRLSSSWTWDDKKYVSTVDVLIEEKEVDERQKEENEKFINSINYQHSVFKGKTYAEFYYDDLREKDLLINGSLCDGFLYIIVSFIDKEEKNIALNSIPKKVYENSIFKEEDIIIKQYSDSIKFCFGDKDKIGVFLKSSEKNTSEVKKKNDKEDKLKEIKKLEAKLKKLKKETT